MSTPVIIRAALAVMERELIRERTQAELSER